MTAELLVNVTPRETRVAVIENGMLQEILVERANRRGLVGNIYLGRAVRVLPGMQAAFVDIGLERTAFLHASDIDVSDRRAAKRPAPPAGADDDLAAELVEAGNTGNSNAARPSDNITELLREGDTVLVQVIKDPIGSKGARLTTHVSIPSCYLVYLPQGHGIGVSQRIEDEGTRARLRELVRTDTQQQEFVGSAMNAGTPLAVGGFIVRTASEGVRDEALLADMVFLRRLWGSILERAGGTPAPCVVHEDPPLVIRTLREMIGSGVERIRIDSRESYTRVVEFAREFIPEMVSRIEHYPGERPIFDLYSVEDEIQKSLDRKVQLKSGGHLVIDQTEAMTTIDVNTGAYVGHRTLEETIFKTNLEATQAIARQLRLRNLGGIIIIDFIDMESADHRRQVLRALEKSLERDHTRTHLSEVSSLGLVQMTRKRTRESLEHTLCESCPTCGGRGKVKTPVTVCYDVFREILRSARQFDAERFLVLASQEVVDALMDEESTSFAELEAFIGKPIKLQVEDLYTQEQYDVVLM